MKISAFLIFNLIWWVALNTSVGIGELRFLQKFSGSRVRREALLYLGGKILFTASAVLMQNQLLTGILNSILFFICACIFYCYEHLASVFRALTCDT